MARERDGTMAAGFHEDVAAPPDDGVRPRLLVADGDPAFRRAVYYLLAGSGFEVTGVEDGRDAVLALDRSWREERPFEILLLELRIGEVSGWDVLRHARESVPGGRRIPRVLLVTGLVAAMDFGRARREGASGLLLKPVSCDALLAEVGRLERIPREVLPVNQRGVRMPAPTG